MEEARRIRSSAESLSQDEREMLLGIQRDTFQYFVRTVNPDNGLVADSSQPDSAASTAAVGLALTCYPIGIERGYITRSKALALTLAALNFFDGCTQSKAPDATGYNGFYYHFLDMESGRRFDDAELSTIDTAILAAGAQVAAVYFDGDSADEQRVRELADGIYARINWQWAQNSTPTLSHGWRPEDGFLEGHWEGYDEGLLLMLLALGAPDYSLPSAFYESWTSTFAWKDIYNKEYVYAGPLFIHQLPYLWIESDGIHDGYMRERGIDYFENSRRATCIHQEYAIRNPLEFKGYNQFAWGHTASYGPGPDNRVVEGINRDFWGYRARGAPYGPDDGTLAPWAALASLPLAPEIVLPTIRYLKDALQVYQSGSYGFKATYNRTYPSESEMGWVYDWNLAINQGPVVVMIENYMSGLPWRLMRRVGYWIEGFRRAGFTGGWLDELAKDNEGSDENAEQA
jgi:hypothetical protein